LHRAGNLVWFLRRVTFMNASAIYLVAGSVFVLAAMLSFNTAPLSDANPAQYERKRARRTVAITLFVVSLVLAAFGVTVQLQSG
jgi:hypothetical protein